MNIVEYRTAVIEAVRCPFCGASKGDNCGGNPLSQEDMYVTYLHDERSWAYHERFVTIPNPLYAGKEFYKGYEAGYQCIHTEQGDALGRAYKRGVENGKQQAKLYPSTYTSSDLIKAERRGYENGHESAVQEDKERRREIIRLLTIDISPIDRKGF